MSLCLTFDKPTFVHICSGKGWMPSCNKLLPGTMLLYGVIRPQCVEIRCHFKRQTNSYRWPFIDAFCMKILLYSSAIRRTSEYYILRQKAPISDINYDLRKSRIWLPYHNTQMHLTFRNWYFPNFCSSPPVNVESLNCSWRSASSKYASMRSRVTPGLRLCLYKQGVLLYYNDASNHRQPNCLYNNLFTLTKREHKNHFFKIYIWIQLVS